MVDNIGGGGGGGSVGGAGGSAAGIGLLMALSAVCAAVVIVDVVVVEIGTRLKRQLLHLLLLHPLLHHLALFTSTAHLDFPNININYLLRLSSALYSNPLSQSPGHVLTRVIAAGISV